MVGLLKGVDRTLTSPEFILRKIIFIIVLHPVYIMVRDQLRLESIFEPQISITSWYKTSISHDLLYWLQDANEKKNDE